MVVMVIVMGCHPKWHPKWRMTSTITTTPIPTSLTITVIKNSPTWCYELHTTPTQSSPLVHRFTLYTSLTPQIKPLSTIASFSPHLSSQTPTNILAIMGMVFGKIRVETPKFEVLQSTADYEIRKYPPSVVAEITYDPTQFKGDKDAGFSILAKYIGAFGNPQNTKPEKIAMTSPVITKAEKIAMTSPVVTKGSEGRVTMQFTLPEKYKKAEEAPTPVDERVVITEEGEKKYGVVGFNGVASEGVVTEKLEKLKKDLERDGFKIAGEYVLGRYNPPWCLPYFRTNEVMVPVE